MSYTHKYKHTHTNRHIVCAPHCNIYYLQIYIHTYIHTYITRPYLNTYTLPILYTHPCILTYIHSYLYTHVKPKYNYYLIHSVSFSACLAGATTTRHVPRKYLAAVTVTVTVAVAVALVQVPVEAVTLLPHGIQSNSPVQCAHLLPVHSQYP